MKILLTFIFVQTFFLLPSLAQEQQSRLLKFKSSSQQDYYSKSDFNQKGVKLFFQGNKEEGIRNLELAHENNPSSSEVLYNMSGYFLAEKKYGKALKNINKALEMSPKDNLYLNRKAKLLINLEKYDQAIVVYQNMLKNDPNDGQCYSKLGAVYALLNKWEKAESNLLKAKNILGDKPPVLNNLANAYLMQKKYKEAIRVLNVAQIKQPNAEREITLGVAYEGLGSKQNALEHYYKAKHMGYKRKLLDKHITRVINK